MRGQKTALFQTQNDLPPYYKQVDILVGKELQTLEREKSIFL